VLELGLSQTNVSTTKSLLAENAC